MHAINSKLSLITYLVISSDKIVQHLCRLVPLDLQHKRCTIYNNYCVSLISIIVAIDCMIIIDAVDYQNAISNDYTVEPLPLQRHF